MLGFDSFFSKNSQIPIFKFLITTTKADFMFFKRKHIKEEDIFIAGIEG